MPRLRGECLSDRLERGPMPPEEAVRIFSKLACAVHAAGMIHRDIKPENVFIVDGNPVLLDFGIARDMHAARSTTTVFAAPRDARSKAAIAMPTPDAPPTWPL